MTTRRTTRKTKVNYLRSRFCVESSNVCGQVTAATTPIVVHPIPTIKINNTINNTATALLRRRTTVVLLVNLSCLLDGTNSGIRTVRDGELTLLRIGYPQLTFLRYFVEQASGRTQWDPPAPMSGYGSHPPPPGQYG